MEAALGQMLDDLRDPANLPGKPPGPVELVTTHISWVLLAGERVWKLARPVDLGFVDFSTLAERRDNALRAVQLNRRLAEDVYLGVDPVVEGEDGVHRIAPDEPGLVVDHAVRMRRLDGADTLERRLAAGRADAATIHLVARRLAAFFATAQRHPDPDAADELARLAEDNFAAGEGGPSEAVRNAAPRHRAWFARRFAALRPTLRARCLGPACIDGHGDLRLEHVYVDCRDRVRVLDCLEFDADLRRGDLAADAAFLSMELRREGRDDLADRFLTDLAFALDDPGLWRVVACHEHYRAWVRLKVGGLLQADPGTDDAKRRRLEERAAGLLAVAERIAAPPPPCLFAVGGLPGTGKSTVAAAIAAPACLPVLGSDHLRRHLTSGDYSQAAKRRVYARLRRHAEAVLAGGRGAVVDATFADAEERARLDGIARRRGVEVRWIETVCDADEVRRRLAERAKGPSLSDADEAVYANLRADWAPFGDAVIRIDTAGDVAAQVAALLGR